MFESIRAKVAREVERRMPRLARRFLRRKDGATAVEFALVMLPFITLVMMTVETAIVFLAQQTLETAVSEAGRYVMTGQAQTQGFNAASFKSSICAKNYVLFDCANGMYVDVRTYSSFAGIDPSVQHDGQGNPVTQYQPGNAGDIVVVRLMYRWPITTPLAQTFLADPSSDKRLLVATAAFRNEPFGP